MKMLRDVIDCLNMGVYVTDTERHITLWNTAAEKITGHRRESIMGTACWDGVLNHVDAHGHPLCATHLCPLYRAIQLDRQSAAPMLVFAHKADGKRVAVSVSVAPLHDDDGKVIGGIETFRDETGAIVDLEFAAKIQKSLTSAQMPKEGNLVFDAGNYPKDLVGGDMHDVRDIGGGRYAFFIADVRGHGVSAALYTMWLRSLIDANKDSIADPAAFLTAVNADLSSVIVSESFATAVAGVADANTGEVSFANAGHPALLHYRAKTKAAAAVEAESAPLGIFPEEKYAAGTVHLDEGDVLLAYTDGMVDVETQMEEGGKSRLLGQEGLARMLAREAQSGPNRLVDRLYYGVLDACSHVGLSDDAAALAIARPKTEARG